MFLIDLKKNPKIRFFITLVAVIFILLIVIPQVSIRLKVASVAFNLLISEGRWRPLEIFTSEPIREERIIESTSGRKLTMYIYRPKKISEQKLYTGVVVYTPLIGGDVPDERLVNLTETLARAGFIVVIPWRFEERMVVGEKDVEDVISSALFLKNITNVKIDKLGLFGISYGNAPVISAAVDPRIKNDIEFVVSFAGYYDFRNALRFIVSGEADPYAEEVLAASLKYYGAGVEEVLAGDKFKIMRDNLSPANFIDQLEADIFIAHSVNDPYIPHTESIKLRDAFPESVPVIFALINVFEHGTYKELNFENIRRYYFPSAADFYNFFFKLIKNHL